MAGRGRSAVTNFVAALTLASTLVLALAPSAQAQTPICETRGVAVSVDFSSGGRHACTIAVNGDIVLTVSPEAEPINSSPWYAFRLSAAEPTRVNVALDYGAYEHRYAPKIARDGQAWEVLAALAGG
jgi:hypothetical protein